ncbi:TonB-dependent receptor [Sphingobium herbicidovorans]|nr:TonB-dependent receptor [Sphingobium herbicidovorans]
MSYDDLANDFSWEEMMKGKLQINKLLLLATSATCGFSAQAWAQESAQNVATGANRSDAEIVVTATRRVQALQDVPMSINVATGEQIERLKIFDIKDVQQLAPGLELRNDNGRNNTATLRGVSFDPDQGTGPAVDLYFNEVPVDAQTAFTAIYDVDQIEVLRGPQGGLRGRTAPSGAITIRTRRPNLSAIEGYAQATGTEDHAFNVQGGVSLPLVQDKVAIRASMLVDGNRGAQIRNITRDDWSQSRTMSGRLSLALQPAEGFDINLMYQYLNADNRVYPQIFGPGNAAIGNPPIGLDDRAALAEGRSRFINNSHLLTLDLNYDLGPVTLAFVGGHQETKLTQYGENDPGNAIHGYAPTQVTRSPYNVDTAELRLLSNNEGFFNWTIGGYYTKQTGNVTVDRPLDFIPSLPGVPVPVAPIFPVAGVITIPVNAETMALAGSVRLKPTDQLTFEAAGRYSIIKSRQSAVLNIPGLAPISILNPAFNYKAHPFTGSATLTYEFSPDLTVYAAYGRSFRAATAGVGVPQNTSRDLAISKQERSDSFEVGFKTAFLDRRVSLDVSAFYQKFDNFISRFTGIATDQGTNLDFNNDGIPDGFFVGPPDGTVDTNADYNYNGDATVKGIEATIAGRPTDYWDVSVSMSYVKARYDNALLPCNTVDPVTGLPVIVPEPAFGGVNNVSYCQRSSRLADVPNFTLTANSEIRFGSGPVQPFIRGLINYRPSVFSERQQFRYSHRELINLFAGLRGDENKWEISAFVRNVLNQKKITNIGTSNSTITGNNVIPGGAGVIFDSGYRVVNVTNPREFGISGSIRF